MSQTIETQVKVEQAVDRYLQATLKTYFQFKKKKRDGLADAILAYGSSYAYLCLEAAGIRRTYSRLRCPRCRQLKSSNPDAIAIQNSGMCLECEHIECDELGNMLTLEEAR